MNRIFIFTIVFITFSCTSKKVTKEIDLKKLIYAYNFENEFVINNRGVKFSEANLQLLRINNGAGICYFAEFKYDTLLSSKDFEGRYVNTFCFDQKGFLVYYEFGGARFEFDSLEKNSKLKLLDSFCKENPTLVGNSLKSLTN